MKLAIYGSGGIGQEVSELVDEINKVHSLWSEVYIVDDNSSKAEVKIRNYKEFLKFINDKEEIYFVIAVGEPSIRELLFDKVKRDGFKLAVLVHPNSFISKQAKLGEGVVICFGSFISHHVTLNENVYIQPNVVVGHDSFIDRHTIVSPGASIGGSVTIGNTTFVGLNASIKEKINIGSNAIVGMGCSLNIHVESDTIVIGNPAKIIGKNRFKKVFNVNTNEI